MERFLQIIILIQHGRKTIDFNNDVHTVYANKNTVKFDNDPTITNTYAKFTSGESNWVFGARGLSKGRIRLYYLKIYNNNEELVRDYIPVVDEDNIGCLYDKVNNKIYYNNGTGTFIAGPEV